MSSVPMLSRRTKIIAIVVGLIIALLIAFSVGVNTYVDWLWFKEVGYGGVFSTMMWTRITLFAVFGIAMAAIVAANIIVAFRLRPDYRPMSMEQQSLERYRLALTPRFGLVVGAVAIIVGLIAGASAQGKWQTWLLFWNSEPFGVKDPQYGKDLSFYVFEYQFWRFLLSMGFIAIALCIISALMVHYLYGGLRLAGRGPRMNPGVIAHLSVLLALFVGLKAVAYYLDRYGMLTTRGSITKLDGAAAVDIEWLLPAKNILLWIAALCALMFAVNVGIRKVLLPSMALVLLLVSAVVVGGIVPALANQFSIKPSANEREEKYIQRNIEFTRKAYGIEDVKLTPYNATTTPDPGAISAATNTVDNGRVLDPAVLSPTFAQLQQVRPFYDFNPQLDIARYEVDGQLRDYIVGAREMNTGQLSGNQTNWINRHTVYTHGYGFVAAPANKVDNTGAPIFVSGALGEEFTSEDAKAFGSAVQIKQPRIYYGELMKDYSIVGKADGAKDREFDRPTAKGSEGEQINTTYDGKGGVALDSFTRKLVFAAHFREKNFLLSSAINENSKVMYVRDPRSRVEKVAPFLKIDADPYPAVVDGRVQWIIDAYTTSNAYPYAQRTSVADAAVDSGTGRGTANQPDADINYIRNSVKATVDAYDGTVSLYTWDETDPMLKTWNKVFDGIVKDKSEMPEDLVSQLRYPQDMFKVQRKMLANYHVDDPQGFFGGQDFWKVPDDPTRSGDAPQPPYYVVEQLPGADNPNFVLSSALTAARRENLAALVNGTYVDGKPQLSVLELPGDSGVPGPNQAQPKMRNDPSVRRELNLLTSGTGGSQVVYGNLLTLPVAGGLLYVEPIYVQSGGQNAYPLMERVLVSFGDKVAYEETLAKALNTLFGQPVTDETEPPPPQTDPNQPTPTPTPSPSEPSSDGDERDAAVQDIRAALEELKNAQQNRDFEGIGRAEGKLDAAIKRYEEADGSGS
ncbi:MAG: COG1615 family transporter [Corynebacteriales bacterium]|nr:COG1615 family transporter [Mycobacteriales bacterium]